jgi:hypothetical protein
LGFDNLDALVMIYRNSFDDAWTNCKLAKEDITKYFCVENKLLDEYEKNFRNKVTLRTSKKAL